MTYTVLWKPEAERRLAELWVDEPAVRSAITQAAHEIDQTLRVDPEQQGESRPEGRRVLLVPPLGVLFRVEPQDRIVYVLTIWLFKKSR